MKTLISLFALLASLALTQAQSFTIHLDGAQDGGGGRQGIGAGTLTLSGTSLTFNNILWSGLSTPDTAAHIHGPGAPGVNASVLYPLTPTFTPINTTSGSINGTLTLVDGTGGISLANQLSQLNSGLWYINIHDSVFPGGEIRGQILPVPEPSMWALSGLGLLGLMAWVRRRSA